MVDFSKKKNKRAMKAVMPDGSILLLLPPTKKLLEALLSLTNLDAENISAETIESLYQAAADILSNNKSKEAIRADSSPVTDFDMEDIMILIQEYLSFTSEIRSSPN